MPASSRGVLVSGCLAADSGRKSSKPRARFVSVIVAESKYCWIPLLVDLQRRFLPSMTSPFCSRQWRLYARQHGIAWRFSVLFLHSPFLFLSIRFWRIWRCSCELGFCVVCMRWVLWDNCECVAWRVFVQKRAKDIHCESEMRHWSDR